MGNTMRIPAQLTLLIAEHGGLVDVEVLTRYSALLSRAEEAENRLRGGVTADSLIQAADAYRHYSSHDTGGFVATTKGPDVYGFHGAKAMKRIAALNVGLATGLPLEVLCHECLYGIPLTQLLAEATEGGANGTTEVIEALRSLDTELRDNPKLSYRDLSMKYADCGIASDMRGWVERWAKRRSYDTTERLYVSDAEQVRQKVFGLWQAEQAAAATEGRTARKSNAWAALCNTAERVKGSGDAAAATVGGVTVQKMTFYQWLHRAGKAG